MLRFDEQCMRTEKLLYPEVTVADISFLLLGRQFLLPHGSWLAVGRNKQENSRIEAQYSSGDYLLRMKERPGPAALLAAWQE